MTTQIEDQSVHEVYFKSYIDLAKEGLIPWEKFVSLMDSFTHTLERSKVLIHILLQEFKTYRDNLRVTNVTNSTNETIEVETNATSDEINSIDDELDIIEDQPENVAIPDDQEQELGLVESTDSDTDSVDHNHLTISQRNNTDRIRQKKRKSYQCGICKKDFLTNHGYGRHMIMIHSDKPKKDHMCKFCKRVFFYENELKRHIQGVHGKKEFNCEKCDKTFSWKNSFENHFRKIHEGLKFKCETCDKLFSTKPYLKNHVDFVHRKILKFNCDLCNKSFLNREN